VTTLTHTTTPPTPVAAAGKASASASSDIPVRDTPSTLDARLAALDTTMADRLDLAAVAYEVNTWHTPTTPTALPDIITHPVTPPTHPTPVYPTPVAALLQRAHRRLADNGWCAGTLVDADGALCLWGAIRAETGGAQDLEQQGLDVLLGVIRRRFGPRVETVPDFNDHHCRDATTALRLLDQAASAADVRGI
jgi:hypothetical protein